MEEVTFRFTDDGKFTTETKGFAGKACRAATGDVERALGKVTTDVATAEMSKPVTTKIQQR